MQQLRFDGTGQDLMQLAQAFPEGAEVQSRGKKDVFLHFNNPVIKGSAASMGLHFGMRMHVSNLQGELPVAFGLAHEPIALEFGFSRGKGCRARTCTGQEIDFSVGDFRICQMRETTHFEYSADAGAREQSVTLHLTPAALRDLLGTESLPSPILGVLQSEQGYSNHSDGMDGSMYSITDEIFEGAIAAGRGTSASQHLFLEGKALQLIAALVERLSEEDVSRLSSGDLDRVHRARELLRRSLECPPSAAVLARTVGMGERRFKAAFKEVFGHPLMSYARKLRLEQARDLLSHRRHNVTEVAHLVGYSNPSKFAAAYRRQFGRAPSSL